MPRYQVESIPRRQYYKKAIANLFKIYCLLQNGCAMKAGSARPNTVLRRWARCGERTPSTRPAKAEKQLQKAVISPTRLQLMFGRRPTNRIAFVSSITPPLSKRTSIHILESVLYSFAFGQIYSN